MERYSVSIKEKMVSKMKIEFKLYRFLIVAIVWTVAVFVIAFACGIDSSVVDREAAYSDDLEEVTIKMKNGKLHHFSTYEEHSENK